MITIYHNVRCSKSRECLAFLENSDHKFHIVKYLEEPPTVEELTEIIRKLGIKPIELVRQKEPLWLEKFQGKKLGSKRIIEILAKHPILIERPIVINGEKAIIARPLEKALTII